MKRTLSRLKGRLRYPPPLYRRVGGVQATVTRADGRVEELGTVSDIYARRWRAGRN